jgi:hypothetical protein
MLAEIRYTLYNCADFAYVKRKRSPRIKTPGIFCEGKIETRGNNYVVTIW